MIIKGSYTAQTSHLKIIKGSYNSQTGRKIYLKEE